jgi:hypothetical protein
MNFGRKLNLDPEMEHFEPLERKRKAKAETWHATVCGLKKGPFKIVTHARHWYYHHTSDTIDIPNVLQAMADTCSVLKAVQMPKTPWQTQILITNGSNGPPLLLCLPSSNCNAIIKRE